MKKLLTSAAILAASSSVCFAQSADVPDNLEKLSNFQTTGVTDFTFIEQTGDYADGIKATLEKIEMPDGFKIEL